MNAGIPDAAELTQAAVTLGGALAKLKATREKARGCYVGELNRALEIDLQLRDVQSRFDWAVKAVIEGRNPKALEEFVAMLRATCADAEGYMRGTKVWGSGEKPAEKPIPASDFKPTPYPPEMFGP
jgi:thioredoxin-like negative regulator of GroEL